MANEANVSHLMRVSWLFMRVTDPPRGVGGFFFPLAVESPISLFHFALPSFFLFGFPPSLSAARSGGHRQRDEWVSRFSIIDKMADKSHRT